MTQKRKHDEIRKHRNLNENLYQDAYFREEAILKISYPTVQFNNLQKTNSKQEENVYEGDINQGVTVYAYNPSTWGYSASG